MIFKGLKEVAGNEAQVKAFCGHLQISFFAVVGWQGQRSLAPNTREGEGLANENLVYQQRCGVEGTCRF